ncbi:uncharacterized protein LOC115624819 [Scaptodrosophila lebanonensis]|uniref:Uncharacterized protein LOC115624819 n=1 Tax=Drosophila lebanonensis TaxID=7225 RepID=A0A6J2TKI3_DROLE|nr:uncharacterized protein LOC115624819 [Scaptodrosophila lebanonensis]
MRPAITKNYHSTLLLLLLSSGVGLIQANTLNSCYSCNGISCQRTSLLKEIQCQDLLDYCVTIFDGSEVLYKGCSLEIPTELRSRCDSAGSGTCTKCNTNRCNNIGSPEFACLQCDSSKDTNCAENAAVLDPQPCGAPTAPNSYCFVKQSDVVQRGCATTVADQQKCLADENCSLCSPSDVKRCNSISVAVKSKRFPRFL